MGALVFDPQTKNPNYPSLDIATPETAGRYLASRNFIGPDELVLQVEPLGAGARNGILRVVTNTRSFVVKRFREWPADIRPAPAAEDRFRAELQFYRAARIADCARSALPEVLHHDAQAGCIILEDAGQARPLAGRTISPETAAQLGWFLIALHHHSRSVPECARYRNEQVVGWQMARLFANPRDGDGCGGSNGGVALARWREQNAGVRYALEDALAALERGGTSLVHGDYTPANWVQNGHGPRVVDGEFSFFGAPEYDVGAYLAGLLSERHGAEVVRAAVDVIARSCLRYDVRLVVAFAGVHLCDALGRRALAAQASDLHGAAALAVLGRLEAALERNSLEPMAPSV
jgi:5-methylthioribose kinase